MSSDVETEDEDSPESVGVDEVTHGPASSCAEAVNSHNTKTKARTRPCRRKFAISVAEISRGSYEAEIPPPKYILALTPIGSLAQNRLQLERLDRTSVVGRILWLHEAHGACSNSCHSRFIKESGVWLDTSFIWTNEKSKEPACSLVLPLQHINTLTHLHTERERRA